MKVHELLEALDADYYMTEGCGIFAMALSFLKPGGQIYIASNKEGEKWSKSVPFEVTHVIYHINGKAYDASGITNEAKVAEQFHMQGSMAIKGPYQPMDFFKKFMGANDSKPLYGTQADIKEAMILANKQKVFEFLLSQAIVESKSAPLYHATSLFRAAQILKANTLVAKTDQHINGKKVMGVSFTRNLQFARTFDNVMDHSRIIFVVDQNKLAQRHKILPIDYFTTHPNAKEVIDGEFDDEKKVHVRRQGPWAESEELVIGDIKNFMNYVTKIIVTKECQNWTWTKMMLPDGQPNSTLGAGDWVERYKFVSENPKAVLE